MEDHLVGPLGLGGRGELAGLEDLEIGEPGRHDGEEPEEGRARDREAVVVPARPRPAGAGRPHAVTRT